MIVDGGPSAVLLVNCIVWGGFAVYLLRLARRISRLEADRDR